MKALSQFKKLPIDSLTIKNGKKIVYNIEILEYKVYLFGSSYQKFYPSVGNIF